MILFIRSTSELIPANDHLHVVWNRAITNVLIKQISTNICARSTVRCKTFIYICKMYIDRYIHIQCEHKNFFRYRNGISKEIMLN